MTYYLQSQPVMASSLSSSRGGYVVSARSNSPTFIVPSEQVSFASLATTTTPNNNANVYYSSAVPAAGASNVSYVIQAQPAAAAAVNSQHVILPSSSSSYRYVSSSSSSPPINNNGSTVYVSGNGEPATVMYVSQPGGGGSVRGEETILIANHHPSFVRNSDLNTFRVITQSAPSSPRGTIREINTSNNNNVFTESVLLSSQRTSSPPLIVRSASPVYVIHQAVKVESPRPQHHNVTIEGHSSALPTLFGYFLNSLLYQRGVCHESSFSSVEQHGMMLLITNNIDLQMYLANVMQRLAEWIQGVRPPRLSIVIIQESTNKTCETWEIAFQLNFDAPTDYSMRRFTQNAIKQVTSLSSSLPVLPDDCVFDIKVFAE